MDAHVVGNLGQRIPILPIGHIIEGEESGTFYVSPVAAGVRSVEGSHGVPRVMGAAGI
jgi:hypothetical protein